jgi:hypothetical protein
VTIPRDVSIRIKSHPLKLLPGGGWGATVVLHTRADATKERVLVRSCLRARPSNELVSVALEKFGVFADMKGGASL